MSRKEALDKARTAGLDLVEISPTATPPVAKIVDWGKYQYQKMKEQQRNKKNARSSEIKQMRLGLKIGQNDLNIKLRKIRKFLLDGDKVKILGNVDPGRVMYSGTPLDVREKTLQCILDGYDNPKGYVVMSGCSLPVDTPFENIQMMMDTVREVGYPVNPDRVKDMLEDCRERLAASEER